MEIVKKNGMLPKVVEYHLKWYYNDRTKPMKEEMTNADHKRNDNWTADPA